ncbi:MAG: thioredoxin [Oscillospiraceae bacterium]|nr:thioredoxin [Oscillospiraceae bacterium]
MSAIIVNKENFMEEVVNSDKPVLIDFWAEWCGPCRMLSPIIEEIANERRDYKVCKVNVSDEPELAAQFQVMSIPALVILKDGKIVNRSVGARPKSEVLDLLV